MKLAILSRAPNSYSTRRLREAATERGHAVKVLNTLRFAIDLSSRRPHLQYRGKPLSRYDAILPRIGASVTFFGVAVVRQFEQLNVYTPNTSQGISNSRDKLRSLQILSRHEVSIPSSTFVRDAHDAAAAIERVGGAPVIIKLLEGTQGIGVVLAPDAKIAEAIIETLQSIGTNVLLQQFVAESRGRDIRALVVGDRVVAAMRRTAVGDEFRSNVHRGGSAEAVDIDPAFAQSAVRAAQIMGLRVAGVDMLEGKDGPLILEVNSSPGLEGIEGATGLDIAGEIIDEIESQAVFPDIDLRQRLTVSVGYGTSEIAIPADSSFVGQSIGDSGLSDSDVTVLLLSREDTVIPNPKLGRKLEAGDQLLCFGRLDSMRKLIPTKRKRRVKALVKAEPPADPDLPQGMDIDSDETT